MIPIGSKQRPLLEYILRLLRYHGVKDIVLLVGYKHHQIVNYFDNGSRLKVNIKYVFDDEKYKGTGGALLNAYFKEAINENDTLVVYYGDILSDISISSLLREHLRTNAIATLALSKGYRIPVGIAEVNNGKITKLIEKPKMNLYVTMAILALEGKSLVYLKDIWTSTKKDLDIMRDLIPYLIFKGEKVSAYMTDAFWYDVGSIERYEKIDNKVIEKKLSYLLKEK